MLAFLLDTYKYHEYTRRYIDIHLVLSPRRDFRFSTFSFSAADERSNVLNRVNASMCNPCVQSARKVNSNPRRITFKLRCCVGIQLNYRWITSIRYNKPKTLHTDALTLRYMLTHWHVLTSEVSNKWSKNVRCLLLKMSSVYRCSKTMKMLYNCKICIVLCYSRSWRYLKLKLSWS